MNRFFYQLSQMLQRYTVGQRVIMATLLIGMVSAIISLVIWANRDEYKVLYSDMDPSIASKMVGNLQDSNVSYKLENGGRTLLVPKDDVSEWRLRFTELGYVGDMISGYELFDNNEIGMTTFKQKLNMRRALEGELTRTINQFPGVVNSRVHLVLPEGKLFQEESGGKGSVVLYLAPGTYFDRSQVKGINALVANSVDGIEPDEVVVVDSDGNLLSDNQGEQAAMGATGSQWDLKTAVESKIQTKVQDILDGVLGYQNSVVKVTADLNFEQIERTTEAYDPENVVVLSEERHTETSSDPNAANFSKENVLTNYELNKTTEHYVAPSGEVERLAVAVLVNGKYNRSTDAEGNEVKEYAPRSGKELTQIAALVKSAVGYNESRGDVVQVENIQFDTSGTDDDLAYFEDAESKAFMGEIINKGIFFVSILIAFFFVKSLLKNLVNTEDNGLDKMLPNLVGPGQQLAYPGGQPTGMIGAPPTEQGVVPGNATNGDAGKDIYAQKLSPEAQASMQSNSNVTQAVIDHAKENPEGAAQLVKSWIAQP